MEVVGRLRPLLRRRLRHTSEDSRDTPQYLLQREISGGLAVASSLCEEDLAHALLFRPVVPALQQSQMVRQGCHVLCGGALRPQGLDGAQEAIIQAADEAAADETTRSTSCKAAGGAGCGGVRCERCTVLCKRNGRESHRCRKQRRGAGALIGMAHSERRKRDRPCENSSPQQEQSNVCRWAGGRGAGLQNQCVQLRHRTHHLIHQSDGGLRLLHLRVQGGRLLELHRFRCSIARACDLGQQRSSLRLQIALHRGRLLRIPLVRASLEAGRKAHLHLGVDAAGERGVWLQVVGAAAQLEQVQRLVQKTLGSRARGERAVAAIDRFFSQPVGDVRAGISVLAGEPDEERRVQPQPLAGLGRAVDLRVGAIEQQRGFKIRAGGRVFHAANALAQIQPLRLRVWG